MIRALLAALLLMQPGETDPVPAEAPAWRQEGGDSSHNGGEGEIPSDPVLAWRYSSRYAFFTPPSVLGDRLVLGDEHGRLTCFSAEDGHRIWDRKSSGYYAGAPVAAEGRIYAACSRREQWSQTVKSGGMFSTEEDQTVTLTEERGIIACYALENGRKLWSRRFPKVIHTTPALEGDRLVAGSNDFKIYCLEAQRGKHLWEVKTEGSVNASPVITAGRVLAGSNDANLYCLNLGDGALLWRFKASGAIRVAPAAARGGVFFATVTGTMYCLTVSSGTKIWEQDLKALLVSPPVIVQNDLILACSDRTIRCLKGGSGEEKWRIETKGMVRSLAVGAGAGVAGCDDGTVVSFNPEDGRGRWEQTLARKEPLLVSIGGGKIFASSPDKSIYCLRQNRSR